MRRVVPAASVTVAKEPHPLDLILGTQATVRVLRVLTSGGEHAPPRIARATRTSRPAVREALIRLEAQGVVERVGDGRNVLYRLSSSHPLSKRIAKLFWTEAKRAALAGLLLFGAGATIRTIRAIDMPGTRGVANYVAPATVRGQK